MTAEELVAMIYKKYQGDSHVVLEQVADGTGMNQHRWIDAAVFSLWPSKGLTRSAFEVKVTRGDFIRELQNPAKHQWVQECFHEFWIVAPSEVIVSLDELPPGAGFMYPRGGKLSIKKHCTRNPDPKLDENLLAACMRGAHKGIEGAKHITSDELLARSKPYQRAVIFEGAVSAFLRSHDADNYYDAAETQEAVVKRLEKAIAKTEVEQDRTNLIQVVERFQRDLVELFSLFAVITHGSLLAKDEHGQHIISAYGSHAKQALEIFDAQKGQMNEHAQMLQMLLNWKALKTSG